MGGRTGGGFSGGPDTTSLRRKLDIQLKRENGSFASISLRTPLPPWPQGTVRSVSPDPQGEWLATGCDDCVVRVFEVTSGKLVFAYKTPAPVTAVEFSPNPAMNLLPGPACGGSPR